MAKRSTHYDGDDGAHRLLEALERQDILSGDSRLAQEIASLAEVIDFDPEEAIINQGGDGDDLFFILEGEARICVGRREIRVRKARSHVGEIALIDPEGKRSADVIALTPCVVAKVAGARVRAVADRGDNHFWRNIARSLADRLREHTKGVRIQNDRSHIFIGSPVEALPVAKAIERALDGPWAHVKLWSKGDLFKASDTTIESLEEILAQIDFAVLVAGDDDWTVSRGRRIRSPRDNMILEIGLAMGAIGRKRTFIVTPSRPADAVKWPTDLLGLTMLRFKEESLPSQRMGVLEWLGIDRRRPRNRYDGVPDADMDRVIADVAGTLRTRMEDDGPR